MNDQTLHRALEQIGLRYRRLILRRVFAFLWLALALIGLAVLGWMRGAVPAVVPGVVTLVLLMMGIALAPMVALSLRRLRNPVWLAHRIEQQFPDLDTRLLAALEQKPDGEGLGFLQQSVIDQALRHASARHWESLVSGRQLRVAAVAQFVMLLFLGSVVAGLVVDIARHPGAWHEKIATLQPPQLLEIKVDPQDTSIERGTALLVTASFANGLPAEVQLLSRDADGQEQQLAMNKSLDDPRFAARMPGVKRDMSFAVRYGNAQTRWYTVSVFDYPELKQADAKLKFPEYTGVAEKLIEDTRSITAVEGTQATLSFHLNKPVDQARLIPSRKAGDKADTGVKEPIDLKRDAADPTLYTLAMDLKQTQRFQLQLVDADKRTNRDPADLTITVMPNKAPDLKIQLPGHDVDVSPLEELNVKATVWDDFGIKRVGITYTLGGKESKDIVLAENITAKDRKEVSQLISLEDLGAQPDQLLSYHLWAEDVGPDGKVRRTLGDMFFAEVRPFEEIFRQGQQPAAGQEQQQQQRQQQQQGQQQNGQNVQRAEDLADLEKQIIAATWKVMRRETADKPGEQFVPDVKLIAESQTSTSDQATALGERLTDERSQGYLKNVLTDMTAAVDQLQKAQDGPSAKPLELALASEQAAYQDILRMRARESEVVRSSRQQGQQSQNSRTARQQRQLNQLDLENQENRYQAQRNAQQQNQRDQNQDPAQQENRQVVSRLRELAQRQDEINRQMRELQAALQQAQTQAQRDEVQRQLARLRDQQEQQLRDADELQNRMEQPQNQERMANQRGELSDTRDNLQRASQQLNQGQVAQAQAAGQRASEQLNNLRDEVRQQAAGQFGEALSQMRQDARQLDQNQQALSQRLAQLDQQTQQPSPGLRDNTAQERQQVAQGLQTQRQDLTKLLDNMRQTVEQADQSEPLLANRLYDTIRQTTQQQPDKALDTSRQMVQQGLLPQARQSGDDAGRSIGQLRQGVEQAAQSVLGNETESLRRARAQLDELSQQLNQEIASGRGGNATQPGTQPGQRGQQGTQMAANDNGQRGQQGQNGQQGQPANGQQDSERQLASAQGQRGQNQNGQEGQPGASGQRGQNGQRGQQGQQGQQPGQGEGQDGERQLASAQGRGQQPGQQGQQGQQGQGQQGQAGQGQQGRGQGQQAQAGQGQGERGQGQGGQRGQGQQGQLRQAGQGQQGEQGQPGQGQQGQRGQGQGGQGEQAQAGQRGQGQAGEPGQGQGGQGQARGGQQGQRGGQGQAGQQGQGQAQDQQGQPQLAQGQGEQPGQGQGRGGQQPGQGRGGQARGGQPGGRGQRGEGQPGEQVAQAQNDQAAQPGQQDTQADSNQQGGNPQPGGRGNGIARGGPNRAGGSAATRPANIDPNAQDVLAAGPFRQSGTQPATQPGLAVRPISGYGFREWTDRLRDVEEMVDDPALRARAAQIRQRATEVRAQTKNAAGTPDWNVVQETIGKPLNELRDSITQELLRRDSAEARVPIDREPVPPAYSEQVRLYYERLGEREMNDPPTLVWGAMDWAGVAAGAGLVLLVLLALGYHRAPAARGVRITAATLKAVGILILLLCLLDPLFTGKRARPGANQFVVLADNSQSMTLKDAGAKTRGEELKASAGKDASWLAQLGRDFDLRQYAFDSQLRTVNEMDTLAFDGATSNLGAALDRLVRRYQGRPLAGVLLLTDGGATDAEALETLLTRSAGSAGQAGALPPIYPVVFGKRLPPTDISLERLDITQTNFEDAPVTIVAHIATTGEKGQSLAVELLDDTGRAIQQQKVHVDEDGKPLAARFNVKPERPGISFYTVRVAVEGQTAQFTDPGTSSEATLANNSRIAVIDRGAGPYRVLYVAGRPTWEYKFMDRSILTDDQVQLVGLIRVAKREPKFTFSSRPGERANPIYGDFNHADTQPVEQYDQPVIMRFGTADQAELHAGFPKTADELFKYHAIILDNVESDFFNQDQMQLVKDFVRQRGGGLLMLGGEEAFRNGKFDRTPIGDVLPVYCDEVQELPVDARFRISLTKEGSLEPWLRLRSDESSEKARLDMMPSFRSLNPVRGIKPGATILARAIAEDGSDRAALVEQRFGTGRTAALLLGDMWVWLMNRPANSDAELEKSWRQTIRWLVGEVPKRVEMVVDPRHEQDDPDGTLRLAVQVRDATYAPLDNAVVNVRITSPDKKNVDMRAVPSPNQPGRYEVAYVPRQPGAYLAQAAAEAPDGSDVGIAQAGWASDPAADEFHDLQPNTALLERLARATGGEVVNAADLAKFAASLPTRKAQITEPYIQPLWHQSWVFLIAIACLAAEWGLRRWKGLP